MIFGLNGVDAHQCGIMHFVAIRPKWRDSSEIGIKKKIQLYYGHPWLAGKRLVRTMQRMQFRAKSAKMTLSPQIF